MEQASCARLPDGRRLHFHHGPIDLILGIEGPSRAEAEIAAFDRFRSLLQELVDELPILRSVSRADMQLQGNVAQKMLEATMPMRPKFITPMAAVAGAVADEIIRVIGSFGAIRRAWVNNGGDIALLLGPRTRITVATVGDRPARVVVHDTDRARGIATSGWQGRSFSLGIADSVTVVARTAARADAAATILANSVNLPGHPMVTREPASRFDCESDLGERAVTTGVGQLTATEIEQALERGVACARELQGHGLIESVAMWLKDSIRVVGNNEIMMLEPRPSTVRAPSAQ